MTFALASVLAILAMILVGEKWRLGRRRQALNLALHEVRRPLQALALLFPPGGEPFPAANRGGIGPPAGARFAPRVSLEEPVRQAISAVSDLDRELNGGAPPGRRMEPVAARLMADACVRRWQSRAALSGAKIELRWPGPDALLRGDGVALAAALENLIVNAIEHGGPRITVTGRSIGRRVRIEVLDDGVDARPADRPPGPAQALAGTRSGNGRGHGLEVAGRTVSRHGGRIETAFSADGSRVALVLPRCARQTGRSSAVRVNW